MAAAAASTTHYSPTLYCKSYFGAGVGVVAGAGAAAAGACTGAGAGAGAGAAGTVTDAGGAAGSACGKAPEPVTGAGLVTLAAPSMIPALVPVGLVA